MITCGVALRLYNYVYGYNINGELYMKLPVKSHCELNTIYINNFTYLLSTSDHQYVAEACPFLSGFRSVVPLYVNCENAKRFFTMYDEVARESMADIDGFVLDQYRSKRVSNKDSWELTPHTIHDVTMQWSDYLYVYKFSMFTSEPFDVVHDVFKLESRQQTGSMITWKIMRNGNNHVGLAVLIT
ncbi:hypothetical protein ECIV_ORF48 [European chub iridovirus]|nr:hypothetical protein ECIV_ORF48 [European chub iridovirus]